MMKTTSGLLWIFVLLASAWAHEQETYNGVTPEELSKLAYADTYVVPPNNTFTPFFFTNVGTWSTPRFQVTFTSGALTFIWNDVFCAGDRFRVYFLTSSAGGMNLTNNGRSPSGSPRCSIYTENPLVADANNAYTRGTVVTNRPGVYNITIIPTASPFSAGKAYVKVVYPPA